MQITTTIKSSAVFWCFLFLFDALNFFFCFLDSASYCDDDENGVRHIMLCRVIMGNVEMVNPGSGQCHPSSVQYDSGVDDLQNPRHLIVWSMNMNTHIFPEYVVSLKTSSKSESGISLLLC